MADDDILLGVNLKALSLVGLWPIETRYEFLNKLHRYYGLTLSLWFALFVTTEAVEMHYIKNDFKSFVSNATVSLLYMVLAVKIFYFMYSRGACAEMADMIKKCEQEIMRGENTAKKQLTKEYAKRNWKVTRNFCSLASVSISLFFINAKLEPLVAGPQTVAIGNGTESTYKEAFIFSSWMPFDKRAHYGSTYAIQLMAGLTAAFYLAIWDTFVVALMIFSIGQLTILQEMISNVGDGKDGAFDQAVECVKHHCFIIRYTKKLDEFLSPIMLLEFLITSVLLCVIGFQGILEGISLRLAFTGEHFFAMLVQILLYYWHGNELILESLKVAEAVWQSNWYEQTEEVKKALALMIVRGQKPLFLSVGYFYSLSLETFLLILRATYSYIAILRQVYM